MDEKLKKALSEAKFPKERILLMVMHLDDKYLPELEQMLKKMYYEPKPAASERRGSTILYY